MVPSVHTIAVSLQPRSLRPISRDSSITLSPSKPLNTLNILKAKRRRSVRMQALRVGDVNSAKRKTQIVRLDVPSKCPY